MLQDSTGTLHTVLRTGAGCGRAGREGEELPRDPALSTVFLMALETYQGGGVTWTAPT